MIKTATVLLLTLISSYALAECPEGEVCNNPEVNVDAGPVQNLRVTEESTIPQPEPPAMPPPIVIPAEVRPLPAAPPASPPTPQIAAKQPHRKFLGISLSAGVPDGMGLDVVIRPVQWVRLAGGGTYNLFSPGLRGGVTVLPFKRILGVAFEGGHYFDGNINNRFGTNSPALDAVGYTYLNFQGGLDLGRKYVTVFLHAGESYIYGRIHNLNQQFNNQATFTSDPTVRAWIPSAKVGLIFWIW